MAHTVIIDRRYYVDMGPLLRGRCHFGIDNHFHLVYDSYHFNLINLSPMDIIKALRTTVHPLVTKPKKIPYKIALGFLTGGAALIIGFLSFGGMLALWPILPLAIASFVLSIAYDGEIYFQNVKGAADKLLKKDHLKIQLAKKYLRESFPDPALLGDPLAASFFQAYQTQCELLHAYTHRHLKKKSRADKARIEKRLSDLEKSFARYLFDTHAANDKTPYQRALQEWLASDGMQSEQQAAEKQERLKYHVVKGFSLVAGAFMTLGTSYMLVEAFGAIPFLASLSATSLPLIIVPMSIIAGLAYACLTYKSVTDMVHNDTLRTWYRKIRDDANPLRRAVFAIGALCLLLLAVTLTICTAGTWWTLATQTPPLFPWMNRMPPSVMGVANPVVSCVSTLIFNVENTADTMDLFYEKAHQHDHHEPVDERHTHSHSHSHSHSHGHADSTHRSFFQRLKAHQQEVGWFRFLNPFRAFIFIAVKPVQYLFFIGHLISIAVTGNRVPNVPEAVSTGANFISELFEDWHYFMPHSHSELGEKPIVPEACYFFEATSKEAMMTRLKKEKSSSTYIRVLDNWFYYSEFTAKLYRLNSGNASQLVITNNGPLETADLKAITTATGHSLRTELAQWEAAVREERLSDDYGHSHDNDLPSKIIRFVFTPFYMAAALWELCGTGRSFTYKDFKAALKQEKGIAKKEEVTQDDTPLPHQITVDRLLYRIDRHKEKTLQSVVFGKAIAEKKCKALDELKTNLVQLVASSTSLSDKEIIDTITVSDQSVYKIPRMPTFFSMQTEKKTSTERFIESELGERVGLRQAPAA